MLRAIGTLVAVYLSISDQSSQSLVAYVLRRSTPSISLQTGGSHGRGTRASTLTR
jgi:hypothetical protein